MDQLIEDIGGLGKFQMKVVFGILSSYAVVGWSTLQMSFSGAVPDWYCIINSQNQNDFWNQSRVNTFSDDHNQTTSVLPVNYSYFSNVSREVCSVGNVTCDGFWFENPPITIINQWGLVCDLKWVKQAVTSIQMAGLLVGAFIASQLGDRFGRKKLYFGSLLEHTLINIIAGFSLSWEMFAVCRFFIGVGIGCNMTIILPYCLEFFPSKWCNLLTMIPTYQIGISIFAAVAFLLKNWAHVHFGLAIFNPPFLLGWAFFPESPRWLAVHGRIDEALDILSTIAKTNRKALPTLEFHP